MAEHISAGDNQVPLSASTTSSTTANTASAGPKATQRYVSILCKIFSFLFSRSLVIFRSPLHLSLHLYRSVGCVARAHGLSPIVHFNHSTRHERLFRSPISSGTRHIESFLLLHSWTNERIYILATKTYAPSKRPPLRYMGHSLYHRPNSNISLTDDGIEFHTWNRFQPINCPAAELRPSLSSASVNHLGVVCWWLLAAWHR